MQLAPLNSGYLQTVYGDTFRQLGAIGGGQTTAADAITLRFESPRDARAARAALVDSLDGVRLIVTLRDGTPVAASENAADAAALLEQLDGITRVQQRRIPESALVIAASRPDTLARLDPILRDEIAHLPVRWVTER